ncbi:MAG: hypothetical protein QNL12_08165 [Acidimicrobiia bacterium]|nr:hypothetical protein [Acidimicrobiia bacterium]MDX2467274.1 hypothetical protein [Acidimicrobiia bacterium]
MKRLLILVAVSVLLTSLAPPAFGALDDLDAGGGAQVASIASDELPDVDPVKLGDDLSEAALEDLATMAEQDGISLDMAIERYAWHEHFSMLVASIREAHPAEFAGARIESDGDPWIAFRSGVPASAVKEIVAASGLVFGTRTLEIEVIEDRGFTEAELDKRLVTAHYAALDQSEFVANASSGYDIVTGEVTVEIEPVAAVADPADRAALVETVISTDRRAFEDVTVRVVDEVRGGDASIYGGSALTSCTSGFAAIKNSTRGMLTAGHCPNTQADGDVDLIHHISYQGEWGDFQLAWPDPSSTWVSDNFYAGSFENDNRDLAGIGTPVDGQRLCWNGKSTGKKCDDVYELNHCSWEKCHLTLMEHHYNVGGDSGGPYFYSNTGYGITSGWKFWGWHNRDSFSPVIYVDDAIGAWIATS